VFGSRQGRCGVLAGRNPRGSVPRKLRKARLDVELTVRANSVGRVTTDWMTLGNNKMGVTSELQARHIAGQCCAQAPAHAESRAGFVHKLRIALKELNETDVWLRIARRSLDLQTDFYPN
jgi:hypothetical protein